MVAADLAMHDARSALAELCSAYSYPIYAFIRRKGNDAEKSLDLTQSYFQRLLEKGVLAAIDRRKGRFRSFLRRLRAFLDRSASGEAGARARRRRCLAADRRAKRRRALPFEPADSMTPDKLFDRTWAVTLLDGVLELFAAKYAESGRGDLFTQIKVVLTEGKGAVPSGRAERWASPRRPSTRPFIGSERYRRSSRNRSPQRLTTRPRSTTRSETYSRQYRRNSAVPERFPARMRSIGYVPAKSCEREVP